jgi:Glyoxalase/Bleomycin resistance protein/Dioxygenase superfamily
MIDYQRTYHMGVAVADIESAMQQYGDDLGLSWAPTRTFDPLPFWTPTEGNHDVLVHATYSRQSPVHFELVQGNSPFYNPGKQPDSRHFGVWVADVTAETERLVAAGWQVAGAGAAPADGYGFIAYLIPPGGGVMVELVSELLQGDIMAWINDAD